MAGGKRKLRERAVLCGWPGSTTRHRKPHHLLDRKFRAARGTHRSKHGCPASASHRTLPHSYPPPWTLPSRQARRDQLAASFQRVRGDGSRAGILAPDDRTIAEEAVLAGFWPCQGKRHPQASWRRGGFRFRFGAAWHGSRAPMEERSADPILQGRGGSSGKATPG